MGREARNILGSFVIEKIKGQQDGMFATRRKWRLVQDYNREREKEEKNNLRRRRVGVRRHKSQGTRISIGWRNPTLIDGGLKKSEYQEGISGLNKGIERVITYEHFSICCLQW